MAAVEIAKFLLPCVTVLLIAYWLINRPIKLEKLKLEAEADMSNYKVIAPIRLSAYERLVLFLERTSPDEIFNREMESDMSSFELQIKLLRVIREEFEHNVSQQVYVSPQAWQAVVDAKNNVMQLINICATQVNATDKAINLAQTIIKTYNEVTQTPTKSAIQLLKNEIGRIIL